MGLKTEDRPLTFTTAAGKVMIPQVTEEFKIKIKLVYLRTAKVNGMTLTQDIGKLRLFQEQLFWVQCSWMDT